MCSMKQVRVRGKRVCYPHAYLYTSATLALDLAEKGHEDEYFHTQSVLLYCAFALEALLNEIGAKALKSIWPELERSMTPESKLSLLCWHLGISLDASRRPMQSVKTIFKLRNEMVHAKPSEEEFDIVMKIAEGKSPNVLQAPWESHCTVGNATRWLQDIERVGATIQKAYNRSIGDDDECEVDAFGCLGYATKKVEEIREASRTRKRKSGT
jgi:hypothetical protein